jgi:predicted small lipoprotein YifL
MNFGTLFPRLSVTAVLVVSLTACGQTGSNYRPIVDGPMGYTYEKDLGDCKALAEQRRLFNDETKMAALAGAAIGGVLGAVKTTTEKMLPGTRWPGPWPEGRSGLAAVLSTRMANANRSS